MNTDTYDQLVHILDRYGEVADYGEHGAWTVSVAARSVLADPHFRDALERLIAGKLDDLSIGRLYRTLALPPGSSRGTRAEILGRPADSSPESGVLADLLTAAASTGCEMTISVTEEVVAAILAAVLIERSSLGDIAAQQLRKQTANRDVSRAINTWQQLAEIDPAPADGKHAQRRGPLNGANCTIVLTDVVAFSAGLRDDRDWQIIRREVFAMTRLALGPIWDTCHREDRGDGVLIIVPPDIPTAQVVDRLVTVLPHGLKQHNRIHGAPSQIQLRVSVEVGPIEEDQAGVSGRSIIQAARMLDAPAFRRAVTGQDAVLGIIVSPFVYDALSEHCRDPADLAGYSRVRTKVKGSVVAAWMKLHDCTTPKRTPRTDAPDSRDDHLQVSFWDLLTPNQRRAYRAKAHNRVFAAGARLMQEGERGGHVAVIISGLTEIRVREDGAERVVAVRGPGQLIGERSALEVNTRSATVVALQTTVAMVMQTADFAAFISTYPAVLKIVENQIYTRLREGSAGDREGDPPEVSDSQIIAGTAERITAGNHGIASERRELHEGSGSGG